MSRTNVSCVKWVDFGEHMFSTFLDVYVNGLYTDVTLVLADGSQLHACRMVLSMASKFFDAMFQTNGATPANIPSPCATGCLPDIKVIVPDVDPTIMKHVLNFIYTGAVQIQGRQMSDFFEACQLFQLHGMQYQNGNVSGVDISGSNMVSTEQYEYEELQPEAFDEATIAESEAGPEAESVVDLDETAKTSIPAVEKIETKIEVANQYYEVLVESLDGADSNSEPAKELGSFDLTANDEEMAAANPSDTDTSFNESGESSGLGKKRNKNCEYGVRLEEAINTIIQDGTSFRTASIQYGIPKTVLWRKAVRAPNYKADRAELPSPRKEAIEALKSGEKLLNISKRFDIPLSTLHRDKIKLYSEGSLPDNVALKQRDKGLDFKDRVLEAAQQCVDGLMSQSEACKMYQLPKTTIWRKIKALRAEGSRGGSGSKETGNAAPESASAMDEASEAVGAVMATTEEGESVGPQVKEDSMEQDSATCWYNVID